MLTWKEEKFKRNQGGNLTTLERKKHFTHFVVKLHRPLILKLMNKDKGSVRKQLSRGNNRFYTNIQTKYWYIQRESAIPNLSGAVQTQQVISGESIYLTSQHWFLLNDFDIFNKYQRHKVLFNHQRLIFNLIKYTVFVSCISLTKSRVSCR